MSKKFISYFCIFTFAIFQLAVLPVDADCFCISVYEEASGESVKDSCCVVVEKQQPISLDKQNKKLHKQSNNNLCACEQKTNPGKVEDPYWIVSQRNDIQDQVITIRVIPVETEIVKNIDETFYFYPQDFIPPILTSLQTVVLRN